MDFRTDLAVERHELIKDYTPKGVKSKQYNSGGIRITKITVTDKDGAEALQKPIGTYITADLPVPISFCPPDEEMIEAIASELRTLIPRDGAILVAGLGNADITPDAIGPLSAASVFATRHISGELKKSTELDDLRCVSVVTPGVLGKTGTETAETVKSIAEAVQPSAIIAVDALAARRVLRLGTAIQMSDTGISPGSGVGNRRNALNKETTGFPVISVGIPTVVDVQTLVKDITGGCGIENEENREMIVTPREIDLVAERASKLIALAVNKALQPQLSVEEIMILTGK